MKGIFFKFDVEESIVNEPPVLKKTDFSNWTQKVRLDLNS
jgi:hypothetical protein